MTSGARSLIGRELRKSGFCRAHILARASSISRNTITRKWEAEWTEWLRTLRTSFLRG